jgi:hypothetical protein
MREFMSNSFMPWRAEEDATLTELYHKNLTYAQIGEVLGRSADAVDTRRRKIGLKREFVSHKSPPPEDLRELARTMNVSQLVKHYGRIRSVVVRWMDELKLTEIVVSSSGRKRSVPDTFCTMAPTMTCAQLMRLYGSDRRTIKGWLRETGTVAVSKTERYAEITTPAPVNTEQEPTVARREFRGHTKLIAAEAANFLRRTHPSVHRADIRMYEQSAHTWGDVKNVPYRGVNQYFVSGKGIMWIDDLIAYAQTKGFQIKELI